MLLTEVVLVWLSARALESFSVGVGFANIATVNGWSPLLLVVGAAVGAGVLLLLALSLLLLVVYMYAAVAGRTVVGQDLLVLLLVVTMVLRLLDMVGGWCVGAVVLLFGLLLPR